MFKNYYTAYEQTGFFSKITTDYLQQNPKLQNFFEHPFANIQAFENIIQQAQKQPFNRTVLQQVFEEQYAQLLTPTHPTTALQIQKLTLPNTFIISTGHQLNIFGGTLYCFYKILSTINLTNQLKEKYPHYNFIPVFWMVTEDHDFEEISHVHIFGKTLTWQPFMPPNHPTGTLPLHTLQPILQQFLEIIGNAPEAEPLKELLKQCYANPETLLQTATQSFLNAFFAEHGLLVLNPNNEQLKKLFIPFLQHEIETNFSHEAIQNTNALLQNEHYTPQVNPRPINLFYIQNNLRERIVFNNVTQQFEVLNQPHIKFTYSELQQSIQQNPHHFSPNVVLRCLFQQVVLNSLAYIGGGGEIAYWLQLRQMFNNAPQSVLYPMLVLRNSALIIDHNTYHKMIKNNYLIPNLFENTDKFLEKFVTQNSQNELSLNTETAQITQIFEQILKKATAIDPSLQTSIQAEITKTTHSLQNIENKLLKAEKRNFETAITQIKNLKTKLFPNNTLQERYDNPLPYYLKYNQQAWIQTLKNELNPLNKNFLVMVQNPENE